MLIIYLIILAYPCGDLLHGFGVVVPTIFWSIADSVVFDCRIYRNNNNKKAYNTVL